MNSLARYLETLYSADDNTLHAVDATITHWRDGALSDIADSRRLIVGMRRQATSDSPSGVVSVVHAQLRLPSHARIATRHTSKGKARDTCVVKNADEWHIDNGNGSVEPLGRDQVNVNLQGKLR